jgi:hypothetical protein
MQAVRMRPDRHWILVLTRSVAAVSSLVLGFHATLAPGFRLEDGPFFTIFMVTHAVLVLSALIFPILMLRQIQFVRGNVIWKATLVIMSVSLSLYQLFALAQPVA